ncbi:MAG: ATP-binding protein [Deltaproteobacteria bacterium]|nr:ATP-binding protein [Deltaproteobacteria bacterium]
MADRSVRTPVLLAFLLSVGASGGALAYTVSQLATIGERLDALDRSYLPLAAVTAELGALTRQLDREQARGGRAGGASARRASAAFFSAGLSAAVQRGHSIVDAATAEAESREERTALALLDAQLRQADEARAAWEAAVEAELTAEAASEAAPASGPTEGKAASVSSSSSSTTPTTAPAAAPAGGPPASEGSAAQGAAPPATPAEQARAHLVDRVGRLAALVEDRIETLSARAARAQRRATAVGGALAGISLLLSGLLSVGALNTLRPVSDLVAQVLRQRAAATPGRVELRAEGELALLAREWNAMAEAVSERDRRLKERAEVLDRLSLRLRSVLDTIQVGIVVAEGGAAVVVNPAARRLFMASEGGNLPAELRGLGAGRVEALPVAARLIDVEVVPYGPRGLLFVGEDVTARIRDRERLARSERLALVGQMLAQVTHEVRNPLNAMSLHAEILCDELTDAEQLDMMRTITGEIRRIEAVTGRYLELSRGRRPELGLAAPAALCAEVLRVEEEALRRAGLRASLRTSGPSGPVELDAEALRRALRNLLKNAAEAGAHSAEVWVHIDEDSVQVAVSDDGPGMDPETARQAFDPFYTTKAQGTGLGLAITRQELEEVGGQIKAIPQPEGGLRIELSLPAGPAARRALRRAEVG